MKTTPDARASLTSAQATVQTVLLVIVTFVGTWLALYRVPWQVSSDPCLLAAAGSGVVVMCLWVTRWRGLRGVIFERNLLAGFLAAMPLVYVARYLFASISGAPIYWLWVELLGTVIFVTLAVLGLGVLGLGVLGKRRSPWFLAIGMVLHGLTWDTWHYRNSTYIPDWYAFACLAVDLAFGAYVAARVPAYQRALRIETEN